MSDLIQPPKRKLDVIWNANHEWMTHSPTRVGTELLWQRKRYFKEKENISLEKGNILNENTTNKTTHLPPRVQVSIGLFWWMVFLGLNLKFFLQTNPPSAHFQARHVWKSLEKRHSKRVRGDLEDNRDNGCKKFKRLCCCCYLAMRAHIWKYLIAEKKIKRFKVNKTQNEFQGSIKYWS